MTEPGRFAIGFAGGLVTDTEGDWVSYRTYKAEIERLRGLLGDVQIIMDSHNNIVGNLNGEITRLRGLLREGLDHHDEYNWQQRVREALGE